MSEGLMNAAFDSEAMREAMADAERSETLRILGARDTGLRGRPGVEFNAEALEAVAIRLIANQAYSQNARRASWESLDLLRSLIPPGNPNDQSDSVMNLRLRAASFAILGDRPAQARQLLDTVDTSQFVEAASDWGDEVYRSVLSLWVLLFRKRGWSDLDELHRLLTRLRERQSDAEGEYFSEGSGGKASAWNLVASFHLLRAAEIIAEYLERGSVAGLFDPSEQAEVHFDRASGAADEAGNAQLGYLARLLEYCSHRLIANSIWRAARGAGSRIGDFVATLASRERETPVLDLLPPQRQVLLEQGLISSGRRSVVVSLPTSAGKTLIAEFRILQALDRYEREKGWVAYTAPTRALVNQITARLRRDLGPLGIRVERVSPALEVDSVEEELLESADLEQFRVLVATPEKLDLLLRGGWISQIQRPLALIVVDEAHNLGSPGRGLKLELLLATVNREAREANFLLLTPFIPNGVEIAAWLDPENSQAIQLSLEWLPNDRVIGLTRLQRGPNRGDAIVSAESLQTSSSSLHTEESVPLTVGRPLGLTFSQLKTQLALATATAAALQERGASVVLVQQPKHSWSVAKMLADEIGARPIGFEEELAAVKTVLAADYGEDYPLLQLIDRGIGVHHAGLSEEVRQLLEWLTEQSVLRCIVATTTLAQGMNFPVSNVVLATHQYPYGHVMPPEDFWNIAGRAGRVDHGQPGVVLLAAPSEEKASELRQFMSRNVAELNSTLIEMVKTAIERFGDLDLARLSFIGSWSSFLQFIAHTYRQVGETAFAAQVEQVLRGTFGFRSLRATYPNWADLLLRRVNEYSSNLAGRPLSLVDATGFSWESVNATLGRLAEVGLSPDVWSGDLLAEGSRTLSDLVGILLQVPELREQLVERLDHSEAQGDFLSRVIKEWVAGRPIREIANQFFGHDAKGAQRDAVTAITLCCQRLFGSILPTVSWGLSALQVLSLSRTQEEVSEEGKDVPSFVYYGVDSRAAVALRLFGVPRPAAKGMATAIGSQSLADLRTTLANSTEETWHSALGEDGPAFYKAWRLIEGAT